MEQKGWKLKRSNRMLSRRDVGSLYRRLEGVDLSACFYCGDPRESLDHCPPLSVACALDLDKFRKNGGELVLVPCCSQCNSMLGSKKLGTPGERLAYLWAAYATLIEKTNHGWSEEEVSELGRNLRAIVDAGRRKSAEYIRKLRGVEERMLASEEWETS